MQAIKQHKMQSNVQANSMNAWEYEESKRQERKASKQLRSMKRSRKGFWQSGE